MPMKDLSGKTVYDLEQEDFEKLFCRDCRHSGRCARYTDTINICMGLISSGAWDRYFRNQ